MIDFYDISGCYILRPWSYSIWEAIQDFLDGQIKTLGVQNCYFPMFVSEARLNAEKDHVEGFAPEVAWVTKSGDGELNEPIAIRPTSETIMYPAFANWIHSHRDLPLKLNQWNNVVRWEFKHPTPFLRTREFLWQEGHTAHATLAEADKEVMQILGFYAAVYEELLAVPVIPGKKTEKEKFAGGHYTTTVEAYIPGTGRAIQGATSHNLGQNFGKMFKIEFEDQNGQKAIPWQNSWGLTTRTIGVMVMVHSDDKGLVLPPRIAPIQCVIVPIVVKQSDAANKAQADMCAEMVAALGAAGIRVKLDDRTNYNPGWKYNHWELKGVPLRIEVGPRDVEARQARCVRRDSNEKEDVPMACLTQKVALLLVTMQHDLLSKARKSRDDNIVKVWEWKDFVPALQKGHMVLTPFCNETEYEELVKDKSKAEALAALGQETEDEREATPVAAKTLCIPFDAPELPAGTPCFVAPEKPATCWVLWGRSY
jgi:prolyl-tRNA synthetase